MGLLSIGLMTYYITYFTLVALFLFVVLTLFLYFVIKWQSAENLKQEYEACQRGLVMDEILSKLRDIKNDSMESFFNKKIKEIRIRE